MDVPMRPRPWPGAIRAVRAAARKHRVDLVHSYEYWPCLESFLAVGAAGRTALVSTIMTMGMAYYLPRSIPLTLGYRDLLDEAAGWQRAPVHLLEPPIDTAADRPGIDVEDFVEEHDLEPRFLNVVIV
jgi:hypothetical protein